MKQTAVEWLWHHFNVAVTKPSEEMLEIALEKEKEQMKDAFVACWESNVPDGIECKLDAEQYYNETFNKSIKNKG